MEKKLLLAVPLPSNKKFIKVARELHDDGQQHLRVLIQLEGKAQITNQRLFNLQHLPFSRSFHPNIQTARSFSDVKAYVEKNGDYTDWGEFQIDGRSSRNGPLNLAEVYAEALNAGIEWWLEANFIVNGTTLPEVNNNKYVLRTDIDRPVSLILEGPSRTGKKIWARSLGLHNYICGHMDFNANTFRNDVMYNVIDDVAP
ncbi:uncharacterized protein LOC120263106 [Dioscorea cayenensis subsp. rotundata]|uniref:Uncharacterized protein LOC120263106 n=1 Tax=Dioscorea cayennensis subsp. rotundata TaxID=55577 RepID=A0AB40BHS6_DIOCR|nr:uncharacterized protein LOC120263106 [Dioscorea cayenensis subsp. rotundata]